MSEIHKKLEKYIEKICEIKHSQQEQISNSDLKQIAYEMGISPEDWQNIQHTFNAHFTRGVGYYKYKNWDDSIDELEQAHSLNPFHEQVLFTLASSYACRYHEYERNSDKEMSKKYAKECLDLHPSNEQALQLISAMRKDDIQRKITERESLRTLLVAASLGAIVFMGLAYLTYSTRETGRQRVDETVTNVYNIPETVIPRGAAVDNIPVVTTTSMEQVLEKHGLKLWFEPLDRREGVIRGQLSSTELNDQLVEELVFKLKIGDEEYEFFEVGEYSPMRGGDNKEIFWNIDEDAMQGVTEVEVSLKSISIKKDVKSFLNNNFLHP
ncbi:hypothetical protein [Algivirga pacifica]|uniref:Uncharacterized protein n=1 Tax=Algivirga pacifica TaxID=1162670 RepID=A0ABP9D0G5_9BACT